MSWLTCFTEREEEEGERRGKEESGREGKEGKGQKGRGGKGQERERAPQFPKV